MMEILDGKKCAEHYYETFPKDIKGEFHIITVGDDPASKVYVRNKIKACERLGITPIHKVFPANIDMEEVFDYVVRVRADENVLGIILQEPLPKETTNKYSIDFGLQIYPCLDVDGFGEYNQQEVLSDGEPCFYPATPKGIMMLLDYYNIDVDGKHIVIINRSKVVGKPLAAMMLKRNATVTVCHSHTKNLREITKMADIIVTAIGKPKYFDKSYITDLQYTMVGASNHALKKPIIIDVAMCRDESGKLCGDVDFEDVKPYVSAITPVPGGVGPMTVCALMSNLVESYGNKCIRQA